MTTRRDFLGNGAAACAAFGLGGCWAGARSLLPAKALAPSPNYWCTWCAQGATFRTPLLADRSRRPEGGNATRDGIDEIAAFGKGGYASFFPESRAELFFVFDDGWNLVEVVNRAKEPLGEWRLAWCEIDVDAAPQKF